MLNNVECLQFSTDRWTRATCVLASSPLRANYGSLDQFDARLGRWEHEPPHRTQTRFTRLEHDNAQVLGAPHLFTAILYASLLGGISAHQQRLRDTGPSDATANDNDIHVGGRVASFVVATEGGGGNTHIQGQGDTLQVR